MYNVVRSVSGRMCQRSNNCIAKSSNVTQVRQKYKFLFQIISAFKIIRRAHSAFWQILYEAPHIKLLLMLRPTIGGDKISEILQINLCAMSLHDDPELISFCLQIHTLKLLQSTTSSLIFFRVDDDIQSESSLSSDFSA